MAYFLMTNLLLDPLRRAGATGNANTGTAGGRGSARALAPARIVNVASTYGNAALNFDDLQTANYSYLSSTPPTPADKASDAAVWLATPPEAAEVSGKLWTKRQEIPTPGMGSDLEARRRLWDACTRMAELS